MPRRLFRWTIYDRNAPGHSDHTVRAYGTTGSKREAVRTVRREVKQGSPDQTRGEVHIIEDALESTNARSTLYYQVSNKGGKLRAEEL